MGHDKQYLAEREKIVSLGIKATIATAKALFELKLDPEHPWFAEAGLLPETVREFGLGFCSKGMMGGRIAFPIRNAAGELVGYAGRWPGDQPPEGEPLWRYPKELDLSPVVLSGGEAGRDPAGRGALRERPAAGGALLATGREGGVLRAGCRRI